MLDNTASHTVRNFKLRGIVLLQGSRSTAFWEHLLNKEQQ